MPAPASVEVLILGGGLAGLSTAHHLGRGLRSLVAEKDGKPGGRAGSIAKDGFLFDHTGHLLHLHDPYGKKLILSLLRGNAGIHRRDSRIYSHGTFTRYPFQANTFGLPPRVVEECSALFLKNRLLGIRPPEGASFERWCRDTFGEGICRNFMFPYNLKLWRRPLSELTTDWQGRFLPKPSPEEVLNGALLDQRKSFGYNAAFRYPLRGGSQALPDALAARVRNLRLGARVLRVDLEQKTALIKGLGEVRYERLVNTLPLDDFLDLAYPLPASVRAARARLRRISVYNLNLGVARGGISPMHWAYFPEKRFVFYRVGFQSNFAKTVAPRGATSIYIEISRRPEEKVSLDGLESQALQGLRSCGLLKSSDRLLTRLWIPIGCAYVVYDKHRSGAVSTVMRHLESVGAYSIGRWGGWKYSFMEETILDGKRCAEKLLGLAGVQAPDESQAELVPLK